ncbi:hypothetical protein DCAR_0101952 [Daucus carota subsp. sativus]|uniref:Transmembrane protein n=1 Tax=Daucus carota subsp. sativus TaxID=79200 RepID=A0AAF1AG33_DAUCS|nr:hypothetical protein DCAR_0101952 [Daucus carota subsp. sativus]
MASSSLTIYLSHRTPRKSLLHCSRGVYMTKLYLPNTTNQFHFRPLCCVNGGAQNVNIAKRDRLMLEKLRSYGLAGLLSYGLLNTAYYSFTFLLVWFYVVPAPGKLGYLASVKRFFKLLAMVWAGSQVTKLIRAAGALALAPFVKKGLSGFTLKFKFQSEGKKIHLLVSIYANTPRIYQKTVKVNEIINIK